MRTEFFFERKCLLPILLLFICFSWPADAYGQAVKGTLVGLVKDTSGGLVPGATVEITEIRTNLKRQTVTNDDGNYVFPNLQDGLYQVAAELTGFKKVVQENVEVKVNTTVRIDLVLQVGEVSETVTVTLEGQVLQTDRADTGRDIESKQLAEMPLGFNRNFQGMLRTVPGATLPFRPHSQFFNPQDSLSTQVNGQSRLANNVLIEGIDDNHRTGLLTVLIPSLDAIEAVNVSTSNYEAEFGRSGGAVTSVTLKSGTNEFHGSGFFFGNSDATDATEYFSHKKAPSSFRQFGFTLGGPIIKNKLFFFGDYQRTDDNLGSVRRTTIPTMDFREGNLSAAPTKIYDPVTGNPDGTGRLQFPNNTIPAARISPIAKKILALLPQPNVANAALGSVNHEIEGTREKTADAFDVKINYQVSENDSLSGRFSYQRPKVFDPGTFGEYGGPANGGFAGTGTNATFSTAVNYTRSFSPTLIMEARGGGSYYHNEAVAQGHGLKSTEEMGIKGVNFDDFTSGITSINITGYGAPLVGFSASLPWDRSERTIELASNFTKMVGNHTFKVGADYRHNRDFLLQVQDNGGPRGQFTFAPNSTALPGDSASLNGFGNAFASFLLDLPNAIGRDLRIVNPGVRHSAIATFVHDKWQVTPKITVDLGLRHEYYTPLVGLESKGGLSNYDFATNSLRVAGYGDIPANVGVKSYYKNFAPRLGFAYRLQDGMVLRAGYGVSTIPFPDNRYAYNFPVKQNNQFNAPSTYQPAGSMAAGFQAPIIADIPANGIIPANTPWLLKQGYQIVPSDLREAALHSWNFAFQARLPGSFTGEIAYVGNRGVDVLAETDLNAGMVLGADNAGRAQYNLGRTATSRIWWKARTEYNSLQLKVDRKFTNGLMVNNSYTYGRSYDYHSENGLITTPIDKELSWGPSNHDRTHIYANSFVYQLPFLKSANAGIKHILGGWQLSGIFSAMSGNPVDVITSAASLKAPGNTQRPNMTAKPAVTGKIGPGQKYFDTSVFSAPAAATFGNLTRNAALVGPRFVQLDGALVKRVTIKESMTAEFRVDAFNVTNSPNFGGPNANFGQTTFGEVTGSPGNQRVFRFGAKFTF